jgi:RNA polymerase sigma factor (sigma-70 family)
MPSLLHPRRVTREAPSYTLQDDVDLVVQAKRDPGAFATPYDRYVPAVYGYCFHQLESREIAEDATSLVFAKALAGLSSQRGSSFRGWLFGIAHHVVADARKERHGDLPLEVAAEMWDPALSPEGVALARETHRRLAAALAHLTPEQRQVVELRLAGLSSAEIGQALGRSRGAVDVAQHRAVLRLRGLLAGKTEVEEVGHGPR